MASVRREVEMYAFAVPAVAMFIEGGFRILVYDAEETRWYPAQLHNWPGAFDGSGFARR